MSHCFLKDELLTIQRQHESVQFTAGQVSTGADQQQRKSTQQHCLCLQMSFASVHLSCPVLTSQCSSCFKVPNGEATDMEMPGKSSTEEEARGGAFIAGENLMGRCYGILTFFFFLVQVDFSFFTFGGAVSGLRLDIYVWVEVHLKKEYILNNVISNFWYFVPYCHHVLLEVCSDSHYS